MKILLFGTGDYYERYKKWFEDKEVLALLDNSLQKQNTFLDGLKIFSPEEGINLPYDVIVILSFYVKPMREQLIELGVPDEKIYHFYDLHQLFYNWETKKPIQYFGITEEMVQADYHANNKILLLSQDMMLGGASIALFHAAEMLIKHGYNVVYASMIDGPLRERLLSGNIPVIVDVNLQIETMREADWTSNFSLIFCNTINFHVFLSERNTDIPVIWWLHDSAFFYNGINQKKLQDISRRKLKVYSVGPIPKKAIHKFVPALSVDDLFYGVTDMSDSFVQRRNRCGHKVCFVTIGYIGEIKGQDILVQAIQELPCEIREQAVFYLVGQKSSIMAQKMQTKIGQMPEIVTTGMVDREKINEILSSADIMICPSREDSMPTVVAEAMMHSVPCIISDAIGTAEYIQDGFDGFIFHSESVQELASKISWCVNHYDELQPISARAREIYEKHFSMGVFEERLLKIIRDVLNGNERV